MERLLFKETIFVLLSLCMREVYGKLEMVWGEGGRGVGVASDGGGMVKKKRVKIEKGEGLAKEEEYS
jgi:hypothetical protein